MSGKDSSPVLEQFVSTRTICAALEIPDRTLRRHIAAGLFPKPDARLGNRLRWRRSTVETHLENVKPR